MSRRRRRLGPSEVGSVRLVGKNRGTGFFILSLYVTDSLQRQPGAITWGGAEQSKEGNGMTYIYSFQPISHYRRQRVRLCILVSILLT